MRLGSRGTVVALLACVALASPAAAQGPTNPHIAYDRYSLTVDGRRLIVYSGELNYFRMPARAQWADQLARVKAAGFNTVETLVPWGYHEPAKGAFRFGGRYDVEAFLAAARDAGLYVIVRPGPNVTGGVEGAGEPSWLLGRPGYVRTDDPAFTAEWKRWYAQIVPRLARWQIGGRKHGTLLLFTIENEYPGAAEPGPLSYMRDLYDTARAEGITVPINVNDNLENPGLAAGRTADLYGFDSYPLICSAGCLLADYGSGWGRATFASEPPTGGVPVDDYEAGFRAKGVQTPLYATEIANGQLPLILGWGSQTPESLYRQITGYTTIQQLSIAAQGLTLSNQWTAGGTISWGYTPSSSFATSYDWLTPVRAWGGLGPRFDEQRRVTAELAAAQRSLAASDAVDGAVTADPPDALYRVRRSAADGGLHIFLRNLTATGETPTLRFGDVATPPVPLPARSLRYLVAGVRLGGWGIDWSTAEVLDATPGVLVLMGDAGQRYEAQVEGRRLGFTVGAPRAIRFAGGRTVLVVGRDDGARTWLRGGQVVVGPALVTPRGMETLAPTRMLTVSRGRLRGQRLAGPPPVSALRLPALARWRYAPGSPESRPGYDDRHWRRPVPTTANQVQPKTSPTLYADDNGFATGFVWYRGHFDGAAQGVCIEGRHRYQVWLNGHSLGSVTSAQEIASNAAGRGPPIPQEAYLRFPRSALRARGNVLAVLTDDWGHSLDVYAQNWVKTPRGLWSAALDRGSGATCGFTVSGAPTQPGEVPADRPVPDAVDGGIDWRLRGGRLRDYPNASGLDGELRGWWRPGFDDRRWQVMRLPRRAPLGPGEVGWFRTTFAVRVPRCVRAPLGIAFSAAGVPDEVWVNGVHVARAGRDAARSYTIPPGLLHTDGRPNSLVLARWALNGSAMPRPALFAYETARTCDFT